MAHGFSSRYQGTPVHLNGAISDHNGDYVAAGINGRFSYPFEHGVHVRKVYYGGGYNYNSWGVFAPVYVAPIYVEPTVYVQAAPVVPRGLPQQAPAVPPAQPAQTFPLADNAQQGQVSAPQELPPVIDAGKLDKAQYATGKHALNEKREIFVAGLAQQITAQLTAQGIDPSTPEGRAKLAKLDFNAAVAGGVSRLPYHDEKSDGTKNRELGVQRGADYAAMLTEAAAQAGFTQDHVHVTYNQDPAKTIIPDASHPMNAQSDRVASAQSASIQSLTISPAAAVNASANTAPALPSGPLGRSGLRTQTAGVPLHGNTLPDVKHDPSMSIVHGTYKAADGTTYAVLTNSTDALKTGSVSEVAIIQPNGKMQIIPGNVTQKPGGFVVDTPAGQLNDRAGGLSFGNTSLTRGGSETVVMVANTIHAGQQVPVPQVIPTIITPTNSQGSPMIRMMVPHA